MNQVTVYWTICGILFLAAAISATSEKLPPPCDRYKVPWLTSENTLNIRKGDVSSNTSEIYCHGDLLHTVQMAELYPDSKHFVDMTLVNSPNQTLKQFNQFMEENDQNPSQDAVKSFVDENFQEPESEFVKWTPKDWVERPEFLNKVVDPELEEWGVDLNNIWKKLGRKISDKVKEEPDKYSQIYVDNPVVVPGGRFREIYYWDSYWTMEGLLLCNMTDTVKGMLENFVQMVDQYGLVPNGGRTYYTRRSQPPYLIAMFKLYLDHTGDFEFIRNNLPSLEKEFDFWLNNRTEHVRDPTGKVHEITQYHVKANDPRPESYREDYELASNLSTQREKQELYVELKSGAESGWDYSTRWFVVGDSNQGDLSDLNVTAIAPVDLNSLMCMNARLLSDFNKRAGNSDKASTYDDIAKTRNQTMAELFWDETDGTWYDVNIHTGKKRKFFYLSNIHPLFSGCYGMEGPRQDTVRKVINYLKNQKVIDYIGGVPTTKVKSGEQWDYPNAWAPLQHTTIMGLYKARDLDPEAEELAFNLAEKWIRNNWKGYQDTGAMYEKYGVETQGKPGGGGEYEVVLGFGWSNGVALNFLNVFGDRLTSTMGGSDGQAVVSVFSLVICVLIHIFLQQV